MGLRQSKEPPALDYTFLNDRTTVDYIKQSRLLLLLQGHPEIREGIKEVYSDHAKVFAGTNTDTLVNEVDNYLKIASPDSAELVVVDDAELRELEQFGLFEKLAIKFKLVQMTPVVQEDFVPLFYGWFLNLADSRDDFRRQGKELLSEIGKQEKFVQEFSEFAVDVDPAETFNIQNYFNTDSLLVGDTMLHCTAFFTNFVETDLTKEYFQENSSHVGKAFYLEAIGFLITPRTFGVRLKLNEDTLSLWRGDPTQQAEEPCGSWKPSKYSPTNGPGSRAHLTLGVRGTTSAVRTGLDLLEIIKREVQSEQSGQDVPTVQLERGSARCYGNGLWAVYLNKSQKFKALFSNYYNKKTDN